MAKVKAGEPFGLDAILISSVNWDLALKRVLHDLKTDFIYAPHLWFIYSRAGSTLINELKTKLKSGTFSPSVPLTIEVPKTSRIRFSQSKRTGPNYSRPGSILLPYDRIFYQALADEAAILVDVNTDQTRSFSHKLASDDNTAMFQSTRICWNNLQKALKENKKKNGVKYILKIDISNFFGSLNQHTLINTLNDSGYSASLSGRLEAMLVSYTGERSSRGILQGMYPSDLFGNYYLTPIDQFFEDYGVPSARYVDDIYIFLESADAADRLIRELIPNLRSYDLALNESKSVLMPKDALISEEPDLEVLFQNAVNEISDQVDDDDFDADYGFQSEWEEDDFESDDTEGEESLVLKATTLLFDSISEYPGHEENIERFCLPLFSKAGSDYAVSHVLDSFKKRPSMSQIYASYLAKFLHLEDLTSFLFELLKEPSLMDWQKMWLLAALLQVEKADDSAVKTALTILKDGQRHDTLRAVCAVFVGRHGSHARRKSLISIYSKVSIYIQLAIYYSARYWPATELKNAKASWANHGDLHKLLTVALNFKF